ncbi:hypothetical protein [Streptomyces goshikiensis]
MDNDPDIVCTVHSDGDGVDLEADDHDLQDGPRGLRARVRPPTYRA